MLWKQDIQNIFEANLDNLRRIYSLHFSSVKKFVYWDDILNIFNRDFVSGLNENELLQCFGKSKMPVSNEPQNYRSYSLMQFVEFIEFVGRVSDLKYRSMPEMPFKDRLENFLDELCPAYGLQRKEVLIEVDEQSESDDDY